MSVENGKFDDDYRPKKRGRTQKNIFLDAIRESSLLGLTIDSSKDDTEKAFLKHVSKRAFDAEDNNSAMLLKELLSRCYKITKPTLEPVSFNFDVSATPTDKANQILSSMAKGDIPADVGAIFLDGISKVMSIQEITEIADRLQRIEEKLIEQEAS